jgi:hypothetical protein
VWHSKFKHALTKDYAAAFFNDETGVTIDGVKNMRCVCVFLVVSFPRMVLTGFLHSFEALVVILREPPRIQVVKRFIQRIHFLVDFLHRPQEEADAPLVNARIFNAGYMIAYKKDHVFEEMNELSVTLFESASVLMELVERIAKLLVEKGSFSKIPKAATSTVTAVMFKYFRDFKRWKIPDEAKLTGRIWNALMALEQSQMQLPEDEPADSRINVEFRTQIARLRSKMEHIAGRAKLQEYDAARRAQRARPPPLLRIGSIGRLSSSRLSNEQLAHEVILDQDFQLNDHAGTEYTALMDTICENFHEVGFSSHAFRCVCVC